MLLWPNLEEKLLKHNDAFVVVLANAERTGALWKDIKNDKKANNKNSFGFEKKQITIGVCGFTPTVGFVY